MPHKEADIGSETFFRFSTQISNQPLRIEGILWRHSIPHDGIEERFSLPGVESQDFDVAANTGQEWRQRPIFLSRIFTSSPTLITIIEIVIVSVIIIITLVIIR